MPLSPWIILLVILIYGLVHSLMASLQLKALARRWLGPSTGRWYRLVYNVIAGLSLLPILMLVGLLPDRQLYRITFPWVIATTTIQLLALAGLAIGLVQTGVWSFLGLSQLVRQEGSQTSQLVTGGLYRWVRHPLYTAGLLVVWLTPVMTANLLALFIGLTIYIVVGASYEECKLEREYGVAYLEYKASTPMLIPRYRRK